MADIIISITSPVTVSACVPFWSYVDEVIFAFPVYGVASVPDSTQSVTLGIEFTPYTVRTRARVPTIAGIVVLTNPTTVPSPQLTFFNSRVRTQLDSQAAERSKELLLSLNDTTIVSNYIKAGQKTDNLSVNDSKVWSDAIITQIQAGGDVRSLLKVLNSSYSARYPRLPTNKGNIDRSFLTSL